MLLLPACGKNEVKSEKTQATNLKSPDKPATPVVTMTATVGLSPTQTASTTVVPTSTINNYTKQKNSSNGSSKRSAMTRAALAKKSVPMMAAPLLTPSPTLVSPTPIATFTPVSAQGPKKPGSHWPLIIAGIALVAAVGFYFWTKKAPPHNDFPLPPMGGLSPVSGFTAMRKKMQAETKKQSIWNKKII